MAHCHTAHHRILAGTYSDFDVLFYPHFCFKLEILQLGTGADFTRKLIILVDTPKHKAIPCQCTFEGTIFRESYQAIALLSSPVGIA